MRNYILKILLKHPIGRTPVENIMIERYWGSVFMNNENFSRDAKYFVKLEELFDKHYQNEI